MDAHFCNWMCRLVESETVERVCMLEPDLLLLRKLRVPGLDRIFYVEVRDFVARRAHLRVALRQFLVGVFNAVFILEEI